MNMDYSAWEGFEIAGGVDTVISRGTVLIEGKQYLGTKSHGRFLKRGLSQYLI
jgi:dihydropyrimidinase